MLVSSRLSSHLILNALFVKLSENEPSLTFIVFFLSTLFLGT